MVENPYISRTGVKLWYNSNGSHCHREDGPAIIYPNGDCSWILYGEDYTFGRYCKRLNLKDEDIIILKLKYGQ